MTLTDYQLAAKRTAIYPREHAVTYPIMGLVGEAGELANAAKKMLRDDGGRITDARREQLIAETGDVLWYIAALCCDLGVTLDEVAIRNLEKLASRAERGTLKGSGDKR